MNFQCKFNCDNAASDDIPEVEISRILREIADRIYFGDVPHDLHQNIRDVNGNVVGTFKIED
jgi:hypothetical protein